MNGWKAKTQKQHIHKQKKRNEYMQIFEEIQRAPHRVWDETNEFKWNE